MYIYQYDCKMTKVTKCATIKLTSKSSIKHRRLIIITGSTQTNIWCKRGNAKSSFKNNTPVFINRNSVGIPPHLQFADKDHLMPNPITAATASTDHRH